MGKPYEFGILVGRFQMIHAGHVDMIRKARELCSRVGILVGSSQESGTAKNPFTYETRRDMLRLLFPDPDVSICPLPDIGVGNNARWGEYVLRFILEHYGEMPELLISGKEARRVDWFDETAGASIAELYIPKTIDISATRMRENLIADRYEEWKEYTDSKLWSMYPELRKTVLASMTNTETMSI